MSPLPAAVDTHTHTLIQTHLCGHAHTDTGGTTHFYFDGVGNEAGPCPYMESGAAHVPGLRPISVLTDVDVLPSDARSGFH